jgi:ubiquitin carboxyl-terminal hydrolase 8
MNSTKLEDSLSLSPEPQRRAFEMRHKADIVLVYDSHSYSWPRGGSGSSPLSRLWDIIYEHEFSKRLERTPVLLTGGYGAWREFMEYRKARHHAGADGGAPSVPAPGSGRPYNPKQTNGLPR